MKQSDWLSIGIAYPQWALYLAESRGWDYRTHENAVLLADDDAIALTHPYNLLTEAEAEVASADGAKLYESVYGLDVDLNA